MLNIKSSDKLLTQFVDNSIENYGVADDDNHSHNTYVTYGDD